MGERGTLSPIHRLFKRAQAVWIGRRQRIHLKIVFVRRAFRCRDVVSGFLVILEVLEGFTHYSLKCRHFIVGELAEFMASVPFW